MTDDDLRALLEASATKTRRHFDVVVRAMRTDVKASATETRRHFDVAVEAMRTDVKASATEARRHFDVAVEAMRSDVQALAEGLGTRVDGLQRELDRKFDGVKGEFEETRALIRLSYGQLDRRIEALESG